MPDFFAIEPRQVSKMTKLLIKASEKRKIDMLVIHCSASSFGNVEVIRHWHKKRGFSDIGYHFVIENGSIIKGDYRRSLDGRIEQGRDCGVQGAHVKGYNNSSIGICLIGNPKWITKPEEWFTNSQITGLIKFIKIFQSCFPEAMIYGHNFLVNNNDDLTDDKICPGFDVKKFLKENGLNGK